LIIFIKLPWKNKKTKGETEFILTRVFVFVQDYTDFDDFQDYFFEDFKRLAEIVAVISANLLKSSKIKRGKILKIIKISIILGKTKSAYRIFAAVIVMCSSSKSTSYGFWSCSYSRIIRD
jgi:CRISPR/Cas system-associated endonuclease Cas3-HD